MAVVNWNSSQDKRGPSLRHFADLGHRHILAGYYDGPVGAIWDWLQDGEQVQGIRGAMHTTWRRQSRDLKVFAAKLQPR